VAPPSVRACQPGAGPAGPLSRLKRKGKTHDGPGRARTPHSCAINSPAPLPKQTQNPSHAPAGRPGRPALAARRGRRIPPALRLGRRDGGVPDRGRRPHGRPGAVGVGHVLQRREFCLRGGDGGRSERSKREREGATAAVSGGARPAPTRPERGLLDARPSLPGGGVPALNSSAAGR
jgi:hypothetical protein